MCGIYCYIGIQKELGTLIHAGLLELEYRGYDSWGMVFADPETGGFAVHKRTGHVPKNVPVQCATTAAMGHTRWATTGAVNDMNAHPHVSRGGSLAVVHNGTVENLGELREEIPHIVERVRRSNTDTAVLADLLEAYVQRGLSIEEAVAVVGARLEGLNSFVVLPRRGEALVAFRRGTPLCVGRDSDGIVISSDVASLGERVTEILILDDCDCVVCTPHDVQLFSALSGSRREPVFSPVRSASKDRRPVTAAHHTLAEIDEQAERLEEIANRADAQLAPVRKLAAGAERLVLLGCGSAFYAAESVRYYLGGEGQSALGLHAHEFENFSGACGPRDLVVTFTQSGETIDVAEAVMLTRARNLTTVGFVNVLQSTVARNVDSVVPLQAGREQSVLSTKSYTAMVALAALCATKFPERARQEIAEAAQVMQSVLYREWCCRVADLAERLADAQRLFVIGWGLSYPLALESALKLKEASYVHAEALSAGELKHGPLALIEEGTDCLVLAPAGQEGKRGLLAAEQIQARGGAVHLFGSGGSTAIAESVALPLTGLAYHLVTVTLMQRLAYRVAVLRGVNPDRPRNLAKSVTVR